MRALGATLLALTLLPAAARAAGPAPHRPDAVNIPGDARVTITGPRGSYTGASGVVLGDVNGDGRTDVAIGGQNAVWVVFGRPGDAPLDLSGLGTRIAR